FIQANPLLEHDDQEWGEAPPAPRESFEKPAEFETAAPAPDDKEHQIAGEPFEEGNWWAEAGNRGGSDEDDDGDYPQSAAEQATLSQHLNAQLSLMPLSERDHAIAAMLIDALDEDGHLTVELSELSELLPPELEIEPIELETALKHVQHLDPIGVGARDLGECLALQLEALPDGTPGRGLALQIVQHHLAALAAHDFNLLKKQLKCDDEELRTAQALIVGLNPRPGAEYTRLDTRYIVPDVVVRKTKGSWTVNLNPDAMPKLRINRLYADILQRNRDASHQQLSSQLQEAKWLIKNVQQRFDTILRVSQAIVERQRLFFEHGEIAMRPLVLREIADEVGLHESTVSRVTTQKFMLTPRGIYELKYFFGSHVSTDSGGACSATAIRALIKQLVGAENSTAPLSDSEITKTLADQGIVVARRTIAKYRESLHIPPVNLRKTL
ncbi:MAG: RNA polymerase factor sigma-54, partial [Sulfuricellaceae bacterium]|nr:RNA polymerase factor sigma-54 [Sulfuricellaceae bacterium]